jgi:hypothetical protein
MFFFKDSAERAQLASVGLQKHWQWRLQQMNSLLQLQSSVSSRESLLHYGAGNHLSETYGSYLEDQ